MVLIPTNSSAFFAEVTFTFYLKSKNKGQYFVLCNGVTFWSVTCTFYKVLKLVTSNSTSVACLTAGSPYHSTACIN